MWCVCPCPHVAFPSLGGSVRESILSNHSGPFLPVVAFAGPVVCSSPLLGYPLEFFSKELSWVL